MTDLSLTEVVPFLRASIDGVCNVTTNPAREAGGVGGEPFARTPGEGSVLAEARADVARNALPRKTR
jgi:hypothetical protein